MNTFLIKSGLVIRIEWGTDVDRLRENKIF